MSIETARSLIQEHTAAALIGDDLQVIFAPGCSLITYARNHLVREFLKSDCEKMVFVDSDVAWEPGCLLRLAHHPVNLVGGAYRYKEDIEAYPVAWLPKKELWASEHGLLEVQAVPGGFLCVSRKALEMLREKFPERAYLHEYSNHSEAFWAYFHAPFKNGMLHGEDGAFCCEFREAGGQVWLDPELTLTHVEGKQQYIGHIGKWLKSRIPQEVAVAAI